MPDIDEIRLRQILNDRFDSAELKLLCFDLEIPYDDLSGGDAKTNKVIEMVAYCKRRDRLIELYEAVKKERPSALADVEQIGELQSPILTRDREMKNWLFGAARASVHLVEIEASIMKMLNEEAKRKDECAHCGHRWEDINMRITTAIRDWELFIEEHCTADDCAKYTKYVNDAKRRLIVGN